MHYTGSWSTLGMPGFSGASASFPSLAFDRQVAWLLVSADVALGLGCMQGVAACKVWLHATTGSFGQLLSETPGSSSRPMNRMISQAHTSTT